MVCFVWTAGRSDRTSLRRLHSIRVLDPIVGSSIGDAIYFLLLQVSLLLIIILLITLEITKQLHSMST